MKVEVVVLGSGPNSPQGFWTRIISLALARWYWVDSVDNNNNNDDDDDDDDNGDISSSSAARVTTRIPMDTRNYANKSNPKSAAN